MATNQIQKFGQIQMFSRTTQGTFLKNFCKNICSEIEIKAYFHFSHYKSMEIISCHSDESTWATAIKNINFIEANVMTKFQLHPPYGFWGEDFQIFFRKLSVSVAMATNHQIQRFGQIHMFSRTTQGTFLKNFCKNICSEIEIKAYFHFSHYKSMEIITCHSDESTWATAIKNINFIEANVMTKFQLHPPYGFWGEDFQIFFRKLSVSVAMATNHQIQRFGQIHMFSRTTQGTFLKNFCKNICSEIEIKAYFHFSHYKSMEIISCHSDESTWATAIKNKNFVEANVMT